MLMNSYTVYERNRVQRSDRLKGRAGYFTMLALLMGAMLCSLSLGVMYSLSPTLESLEDERLLLACQYALERGVVAATLPSQREVYSRALDKQFSYHKILEDTERLRVSVIYEKGEKPSSYRLEAEGHETWYRAKIIAFHKPSGIVMKRQVEFYVYPSKSQEDAPEIWHVVIVEVK